MSCASCSRTGLTTATSSPTVSQPHPLPVPREATKTNCSKAQNNAGRSGKDGNSILGSIHSFDPALGCDALTFQPCSDKALANHKAVTDSFRSYPINSGISKGSAVAVGRYIEDVYYDGNPWYLLTLAAAEQLYDAAAVWCEQGSVEVTTTSLPFFEDLVSEVVEGTYGNGTETYTAILQSIMDYADGHVSVVEEHIGSNGHMAEQFDKASGSPVGARDLTWSYAAFLTAAAARERVHSPNFGWLNAAPKIPDSCAPTSANGAYISATPTFAASQPPGGSESITSSVPEPTPTVCFHRLTFNALVRTTFGDGIKVGGSIDELGNWDPDDGRPLSADQYTDANPLWRATISVPAGESFEYKFIKVVDGEVTWEEGGNREYSAPGECSSTGETGGNWQT